ncbi:hypothetical protein [Lysobacter gummosus]|uniref:hypothetical protein n=1 Tax=Lysobacter gummosus TaxID=262324 RepID=UPI0036376F00
MGSPQGCGTGIVGHRAPAHTCRRAMVARAPGFEAIRARVRTTPRSASAAYISGVPAWMMRSLSCRSSARSARKAASALARCWARTCGGKAST